MMLAMHDNHLSLAALLANADEVGDCLEWRGPYAGRGRVTPIARRYVEGRSENLSVIRLVWEQTEGPIPQGRIVYRDCCNHRCIRCLKCGKRGDVQRHRAKMGLAAHSPAALAALTRTARARPTTKNTLEQARQARLLVAQGLSDAEVSQRTGIHEDVVADIRRGKAWREDAFAGASVFTWAHAGRGVL